MQNHYKHLIIALGIVLLGVGAMTWTWASRTGQTSDERHGSSQANDLNELDLNDAGTSQEYEARDEAPDTRTAPDQRELNDHNRAAEILEAPVDTSGWQSYHHLASGVRFQYPPDWRVLDLTERSEEYELLARVEPRSLPDGVEFTGTPEDIQTGLLLPGSTVTVHRAEQDSVQEWIKDPAFHEAMSITGHYVNAHGVAFTRVNNSGIVPGIAYVASWGSDDIIELSFNALPSLATDDAYNTEVHIGFAGILSSVKE